MICCMNSKRLSECTYGELKEALTSHYRKLKEANVTGGEGYATPKAFKAKNRKRIYNNE